MSSPPATATPAAQPRPLRLHDSWWTVGAAALLICLGLVSCLWVSSHLRADPALHTAALFIHLAALVLGFGAVLVVDWLGVLWLLGRCSLPETLTTAQRLHIPVWAGLAGLVVSGAMLHPDFGSSLTRIKLLLVLVLALNGLQSKVLTHRMSLHASPAPAPLILLWGAVTAGVSQVCWWGAVVIGFLNARH